VTVNRYRCRKGIAGGADRQYRRSDFCDNLADILVLKPKHLGALENILQR